MTDGTEMVGREEGITRLRELIKDVRFAMLTTIEIDGTLRSRLVAIPETEFDGDLWFFTNGGAPKADEVRHDQRVSVIDARATTSAGCRSPGRPGSSMPVRRWNRSGNRFSRRGFPRGSTSPTWRCFK